MKILFLHPAIRNYRVVLYRLLGDYGIDFLFTSINPQHTPAGKETTQLLEKFPYRWFQARELRSLPVKNVSLDIWRVCKYDTVIFSCLTSVPFLLTVPLLKLLGKSVLLFDETWMYQHGISRYRLLYSYIRFLVQKCVDAIIPAGTASKDMFVKDFGVAEQKIFIAYNTTLDMRCADICEKRAAIVSKRVRDFSQGRHTLLFLARIIPIKALDVLLQALNRLPETACLVVVGSGEAQTECEALCKSLGLEHRVLFMGECESDESVYYYRCADIFVLPSRFMPHDSVNAESWGFTINEAMSLETPVVTTTAVGAAHDLIKDGETGMLAVENDPGSLAEKINYLLEDNDRRKQIGRHGRRWLMERCRYEQNFEVWKAAIDYAQRGGKIAP